MTYYITRKHIFETNFKNTQKNAHEFQFKHTKFNVLSQTSDDNYIYLVAISDTATCCCTTCNSHNTFKKDKKVVYPLVGIYNNKPIIMRFTKYRFYCKDCNKSYAFETPMVDKNKQVSQQYFQ